MARSNLEMAHENSSRLKASHLQFNLGLLSVWQCPNPELISKNAP